MSVRKLQKRNIYCVSSNPFQFIPLPLGMILAFSQTYKEGLLQQHYDFSAGFITDQDDLVSRLQKQGPGVFLFSDYLWTTASNLELSRLVKKLSPDSITIHGGPSLPKYQQASDDFFQAHPHINIGVRGEGEVATAEILEQLALHHFRPYSENMNLVDGLTFRNCNFQCWTRTNDRERLRDVDSIPSPYLAGIFDTKEDKHWRAAAIETNRGCPYGCTFCDWGSATLQKIRRFSIDRVLAEVEWIAARRIETLFIADANFGIFDRDVEIAQKIADCHRHFGAPNVVSVNYAKNATKRLAAIVGIFKHAGIIAPAVIALQTQDDQVLKDVHRSNIKTHKYEELIGIYRKEKLPICTELMIGLPGSTVESFKADLQFFFDRKINIKAYLTKMLPNSPMAEPEYIQKYKILVDADMFVLATQSYSATDRMQMQSLYKFYEAFVGYALLKYYLLYLQIQHGIEAVEFIHEFIRHIHRSNERTPETLKLFDPWLPHKVAENFENNFDRLTSGNWPAFYEEILTFTSKQYELPNDTSLETLIKVQQALIPKPGRRFPHKVELRHNVVGYFKKIRSIANIREYSTSRPQPLDSYPSGSLSVTDPLGICESMWSGAQNFMIHVTFLVDPE